MRPSAGADDDVGSSTRPASRAAGREPGRATSDEGGADLGASHRRNPPLVPEAGMGDGGLSTSGGAAGGARGHGGEDLGRRDVGMQGSPADEAASGPAEYKGTSRFDYDRTTDDAAAES
jgi:hypothetical protein